MRMIKAMALAVTAAATMLATGANAQEQSETAKTPTIMPLKLEFDPSGLSGPGADAIERALANSQFVMLGEDHGYAEPPKLLGALAAEGRAHGIDHYVVEVGPIQTQWVAKNLEQGVDRLAASLQGRPLALPFLNLREEAEAARPFALAGKLVGIDQEFVGSTQVHLVRLVDEAPSDDARALANEWLEKERIAFANGDQGGVMMMKAAPEDWSALRKSYSGNPELVRLIDALAASSVIYRHYLSGRGLDNNVDRVAMIRDYFLKQYRAIEKAKGSPPKFLFKMGATHAGRATSAMNTFDVGSLIEGMAAANGMDALHIVYLPIGGKALAMRPSKDGPFATKPADSKQLRDVLIAAGVDLSVIDASDGHFVIELEPVRRALQNKGLGELDRMTRFMVLGFDFLVTTNVATPGTPLAVK